MAVEFTPEILKVYGLGWTNQADEAPAAGHIPVRGTADGELDWMSVAQFLSHISAASLNHNHDGVYQPKSAILDATTASFTDTLKTKLDGIPEGGYSGGGGGTITSVNGYTTAVIVLTYSDVGAAAAGHTHTPASLGAADLLHGHAIDDITNLQSSLDAKQDADGASIIAQVETVSDTAKRDHIKAMHGVALAEGAAYSEGTMLMTTGTDGLHDYLPIVILPPQDEQTYTAAGGTIDFDALDGWRWITDVVLTGDWTFAASCWDNIEIGDLIIFTVKCDTPAPNLLVEAAGVGEELRVVGDLSAVEDGEWFMVMLTRPKNGSREIQAIGSASVTTG